jgi:glucosamine 6-phosphate synthetase-like amidotransferase/phosphosugar isomerase protein
MRGIVGYVGHLGYVGHRSALDVVCTGLRRLEYRATTRRASRSWTAGAGSPSSARPVRGYDIDRPRNLAKSVTGE